MSFNSVLDCVASSETTWNNIITDGSSTYRYAELSVLISDIDAFLVKHGVTTDDCVSIECLNTGPCALLLLALLRSGFGFAMAPAASGIGELKPTPRFCRYRISAVGSSFQVDVNPDYNGRPTAKAKLYLRTSGSMGASKIVVHSHEKLLGNARNVVKKYGFTSASRAVIPVPIAHMYGFGAEFLPAILVGASIDLQEKTNLLKYLDREKRFQPDIAFVTPNLCEMLLKAFKTPRAGYRAFVTSGQRISEELFRAFDPLVSGRLINQYGSTEMGATAACDPGDGLDERATTIGRPLDGVELRIESASDLYCQHPYGFEGYVDENGEWLQKAQEDNWYRTGDVAAQDGGRISILGRADASVNRSGYLVLLADIERMLDKIDGIATSAVVAANGESKHGESITAFCVLLPGSTLSGAQIRRRCFDLLPHYAIPDEVHVIEELPALPSGKLDRQALIGGKSWLTTPLSS